MSFDRQLAVGKIGESLIAKWFQRKGYNVLPVYEKEIQEGKGPVLFTASCANLVCPDMLIFKPGAEVCWIEAKHKSAFSWYRIGSRWVTGIDQNHYSDYQKVADAMDWKVILMFLHRAGSTAKDTPQGLVSPTGLYGGNIKTLMKCESHRSSNHGRHGMVYWGEQVLQKFAELREVVI